MENIVKAKTPSKIIIEGAKLGKRTIKVTFVPPYNDPEISSMKSLSPSLIEHLKKAKVSLFDMLEDYLSLSVPNKQ
jgi:hypothetical protein